MRAQSGFCVIESWLLNPPLPLLTALDDIVRLARISLLSLLDSGQLKALQLVCWQLMVKLQYTLHDRFIYLFTHTIPNGKANQPLTSFCCKYIIAVEI